MSEERKKLISKLIFCFGLSIVLTILVETLSSQIINYAVWAIFLTSIVYFSMFCAIIADVSHISNKESLKYAEYHKASLKWEVSFLVGFFFLTLIINDIVLQKYDNLLVYIVVLVIAGIYTVYFVKKAGKES